MSGAAHAVPLSRRASVVWCGGVFLGFPAPGMGSAPGAFARRQDVGAPTPNPQGTMTPDLDRLDRALAEQRDQELGWRPAVADVRGATAPAMPDWAAELLERIGALEDRLDVVHAAPTGIPAWVDHLLGRLDALQDRVDAATFVRPRDDTPAWADELRLRVEALEATVRALRTDLLGPH